MLTLVPISLREAQEYITKNHRHHKPPQGYKYGIGAKDGDKLVGEKTFYDGKFEKPRIKYAA